MRGWRGCSGGESEPPVLRTARFLERSSEVAARRAASNRRCHSVAAGTTASLDHAVTTSRAISNSTDLALSSLSRSAVWGSVASTANRQRNGCTASASGWRSWAPRRLSCDVDCRIARTVYRAVPTVTGMFTRRMAVPTVAQPCPPWPRPGGRPIPTALWGLVALDVGQPAIQCGPRAEPGVCRPSLRLSGAGQPTHCWQRLQGSGTSASIIVATPGTRHHLRQR